MIWRLIYNMEVNQRGYHNQVIIQYTNAQQIDRQLHRKNIRRFSVARPSYSYSVKKTDEDAFDEDKEGAPEEEMAFKQNRNTLTWWIYRVLVYGFLGLMGHQMYQLYYGQTPKIIRTKDDQGNVSVEHVYPWVRIPGIFWLASGTKGLIDYFVEGMSNPPVTKMLADPFHPVLHPKTLVLNLSGTLVSSQYIVGKGRKLTVRPGVDKLLRKLADKYQIIFWSDDDYMFITDSLQRIKDSDKIGGIFGRECFTWSWSEGSQRNLKFLNRDPKKIIVVDKTDQLSKKYPNNVIVMPEFKGDLNDNQIQKLIALLQRMSSPQVKDVRQVIPKLGPNPLEKFNQVIIKAKKEQERKEEKKSFWGKMFRK